MSDVQPSSNPTPAGPYAPGPTDYPPPGPGYPMPPLADKDAEHLKVLSICWYVMAGLQCLGLCGGLIYVVVALVAAGGAFGNERNGPPAAFFAVLFGVMGSCMVLLSGVLAFLSYRVGRCLAERRSMTYCFVMAVIACLSVPLGTILGVFTLVVLSRPSVKAKFAAASG